MPGSVSASKALSKSHGILFTTFDMFSWWLLTWAKTRHVLDSSEHLVGGTESIHA